MRKLYLSLFLPLFMLLSQQGAVWHQIGHLSGKPSPAEHQKELPANKLCESCLAFSHLAVAGTPALPTLDLAEFGYARAESFAAVFVASDAPAACSRGPPTCL